MNLRFKSGPPDARPGAAVADEVVGGQRARERKKRHDTLPRSGCVHEQIESLKHKTGLDFVSAHVQKEDFNGTIDVGIKPRRGETNVSHMCRLPIKAFVPELVDPSYVAECDCCCSRTMVTKHTVDLDHPTKAIYGMEGRELLYSPQRWKCKRACCAASRPGRNGRPRKIHTFYGHNPEVVEAMPPRLKLTMGKFLATKKSGVTTKLLNYIVRQALRGVGPAKVAAELRNEYHHHHAERMACFLDREVQRNGVGGVPAPTHSFESEDYWGGSPSANYLAAVFNKKVGLMRDYLDAEVRKRLVDMRWLKIDCSYKVNMHIIKVKGEKMFGTLQTGKNDFSETVISHFQQVDSIDQIERPWGRFLSDLKRTGNTDLLGMFVDCDSLVPWLKRNTPWLRDGIVEVPDTFQPPPPEGLSPLKPRGDYSQLYTYQGEDEATQTHP